MKIGFNARGLRDPLLRGFNRYTVCLLQELQHLPGVELYLYTDHRSPVHPYFRNRLKANIVETRTPKALLWEQMVLPWLLRRDGIDVFHAPGEGGLPAARACPYVLTYHGVPDDGIGELVRSGVLHGERAEYVDDPPRAPLSGFRSRALREIYLHAANVVVTVSEFSRRELIRFLALPPEKVAVTHEAAANEFRDPIGHRQLAAVKQRYRLPDTFLLFVGGFHRHKNVTTLLTVFAELRRARPDLGLVLIGGTLEQPQEGIICAERIPDEDLRAIYRRAAAFVTLSWHEGFCLPIVEAMSCGTPVIASRFGAMPEVLDGAGVLVDPRDPVEVAGAIRGVLDSPALADDLRRRARERSGMFSWRQTADDTMRIYERLVAAKRSALQTVPA